MYKLNSGETLNLLEKIREELTAKRDALSEMVGKTGIFQIPALGAPMKYGKHMAPGAGEHGASNETDVDAAYDLYMDTILERLVRDHGMSEDKAVQLIFKVADALEGKCGAMPDQSSDDSYISMWMGKAKTCGFENRVLEYASGNHR